MSKSLWLPEMSLGVPSMDASHLSLMEKLGQLQEASDADFPAYYASLVARVEKDFREEEDLMEDIDYPGIRGHREQHAVLQGGLHHAAAAVMAGNVPLGRRTVELLPQWFALHISTMDAALAFALQFRSEEAHDLPQAMKTV